MESFAKELITLTKPITPQAVCINMKGK